jgi:hypothetical protein
VAVRLQFENVDLTVEIGDKIVLLIEDKVHAGVHGDQLPRYATRLRNHFLGKQVLPVFLKTGNQSSYLQIEAVGYRVFGREQLLSLLRGKATEPRNAIVADFLDHLGRYDDAVKSYAEEPVAIWFKKWEPWEGFYMRLQEEIPSLDWGYVNTPSGGFLGAWWGEEKWADVVEAREHPVYLQIEKGPLCFKIEVKEGDKRGVRDRWQERLTATAKNTSTVIARPARIGLGTWMTVGRIEASDWLAQNSDGRLDFDGTVARLRRADAILRRAAATELSAEVVARPGQRLPIAKKMDPEAQTQSP